jgi:hypothetical protein
LRKKGRWAMRENLAGPHIQTCTLQDAKPVLIFF